MELTKSEVKRLRRVTKSSAQQLFNMRKLYFVCLMIVIVLQGSMMLFDIVNSRFSIDSLGDPFWFMFFSFFWFIAGDWLIMKKLKERLRSVDPSFLDIES